MFGWSKLELREATILKNLILKKSLEKDIPLLHIFGEKLTTDLKKELAFKFEDGLLDQVKTSKDTVKHVFIFSNPEYKAIATQRGLMIDLKIKYSFSIMETNQNTTSRIGQVEYHGIIPIENLQYS